MNAPVASESSPLPGQAPGAAARMRPLRWRLLALCVGGLLPLFLAATVAVAYVLQDRERALERTVTGLARAVGASVQAEVQASVAVLEALGEAESLVSGRLGRFEERARSVAQMRGWRTVTLTDPGGRLLLSTDDPNAAGRRAWEPASVDETVARRVPTVGSFVQGQRRATPAFPIRVPILENGEVRYVLSAVVGAEQILALAKRHQLSDDHVVAIFDAAGTRIARSVEHTSRRPSPSLQALIAAGGSEGSGRTLTLEGQPVHTAFYRIDGSGWVVAVGIPMQELRSALLASLSTALVGLLGSLALSAWLAWFFARKVSRPIDELKRAAAALGRGEPVRPAGLEIEELQEVGTALAEAARERERAGAERERLLAQATQALQQAQDAARSKDEFLAVLGHELRNPLAPIASALRLMALKGEEATRAERRIVERQLAHMTRLVDDLLDVSRITGRQLLMRKEPMRVGPWIEQSLEAVSGSLGARRLQVDLPQDAAQSWVQGDAVRLSQVLTNLLGNAVKFTAEHGCITVAARREQAHVVVDVADDGPGLSGEDAGRVFELFYQAPQSLHRSRGGLGLGLPIVRSPVEMHGGTVHASSAGPGQGSCFTVRLPTVQAPAGDEPSAGAAPEPRQPPGTRVLVVDDNHDAADTTGALLEACGLQVRVAYTPDQALQVLEDFAAQVGLLDIGLPGMDGYQLAAAIRARGAPIRLVALTGYGQDSDVRRAGDAGFDAHLTKPVGPDELLALVARLARG